MKWISIGTCFKATLFISSYIPLYVLLIVKNLCERLESSPVECWQCIVSPSWSYAKQFNNISILVLVLVIACSYLVLNHAIKEQPTNLDITIQKVSDETSSMHFNYISIYLLSCLGLSLNKVTDVVVLIFLMVLIGFIYIKNNIVYLNPVLQLKGYKIYSVAVKHADEKAFDCVLIMDGSRSLVENDVIKGSICNDGVMFGRFNEQEE